MWQKGWEVKWHRARWTIRHRYISVEMQYFTSWSCSKGNEKRFQTFSHVLGTHHSSSSSSCLASASLTASRVAASSCDRYSVAASLQRLRWTASKAPRGSGARGNKGSSPLGTFGHLDKMTKHHLPLITYTKNTKNWLNDSLQRHLRQWIWASLPQSFRHHAQNLHGHEAQLRAKQPSKSKKALLHVARGHRICSTSSSRYLRACSTLRSCSSIADSRCSSSARSCLICSSSSAFFLRCRISILALRYAWKSMAGRNLARSESWNPPVAHSIGCLQHMTLPSLISSLPSFATSRESRASLTTHRQQWKCPSEHSTPPSEDVSPSSPFCTQKSHIFVSLVEILLNTRKKGRSAASSALGLSFGSWAVNRAIVCPVWPRASLHSAPVCPGRGELVSALGSQKSITAATVLPNAKISVALDARPLSASSGAWKPWVNPRIVLVIQAADVRILVSMDMSKSARRPRSRTHTRIFAGFTSLWMMPLQCRCAMPCSASRSTALTWQLSKWMLTIASYLLNSLWKFLEIFVLEI